MGAHLAKPPRHSNARCHPAWDGDQPEDKGALRGTRSVQMSRWLAPLTRRIVSNITGQVSWLLATSVDHLAFPSIAGQWRIARNERMIGLPVTVARLRRNSTD